MAPRSAAASVGLSPAAPVIAAMTHWAGRSRRLDDGGLAGAGFDAGAGQRVLQLAIGGGIGDGGEARAELARQGRERRGIAMRGHRLDPIARGLAPEQIDRARADRAGGAQQR